MARQYVRRGAKRYPSSRGHDDHPVRLYTRSGMRCLPNSVLRSSQYTPEDAIVFGGNFLHSYDIPTREARLPLSLLKVMLIIELRLRQIEIDTKVPQMFRFPYLDKLCWYVAHKTCAQLRGAQSYRPRTTNPKPSLPSKRVLHGLIALAEFLEDQVQKMENEAEEEKARKLIHDRIPDVVKDPYTLAIELRARATRALPPDERIGDGAEVATTRKRRVGPKLKEARKRLKTGTPMSLPHDTPTPTPHIPAVVDRQVKTEAEPVLPLKPSVFAPMFDANGSANVYLANGTASHVSLVQ